MNHFAFAGLLALVGLILIVSGVYHLAGFGWACVAAGISAILFAHLIARGDANG